MRLGKIGAGRQARGSAGQISGGRIAGGCKSLADGYSRWGRTASSNPVVGPGWTECGSGMRWGVPEGRARTMLKQTINNFLEYLRSVRNSSPHTVINYGKDLEQFREYLSPPGLQAPGVTKITHQMIREFVGDLHEKGLQKSSIARKLAALRSFLKYCVREGILKENLARLVPTPKLPKRIPMVLSAEEMSRFLDQLAGTHGETAPSGTKLNGRGLQATGSPEGLEDTLLLPRDRAILELLYAAGLRVSELTGLNLGDMDQKDQMLRVRGK